MSELKVPKFPKRWSREKRKAARARYIRSWKYEQFMLTMVPKFAEVLAKQFDYFASLPSPWNKL